MPVTPDQARMLTTLTIACRPYGAPRWDAPGVMAAIKQVAHLDLADVMRAATRAAEDTTAKTPAVIAATSSHHWRDRERPAGPPAREPYDRAAFCGICSEPSDRCERKWADHEFTPAAKLAAETARDQDATHAAVAALKASIGHTRPPDPHREHVRTTQGDAARKVLHATEEEPA